MFTELLGVKIIKRRENPFIYSLRTYQCNDFIIFCDSKRSSNNGEMITAKRTSGQGQDELCNCVWSAFQDSRQMPPFWRQIQRAVVI